MADVFPTKLPGYITENPYRSSEIKVYRALEEQLPDNFLVFYSSPWLGTNSDGSERDGEADFVVAHPALGLLVIEVKGGRIEIDENNQWWSIDKHNIRQSIKNPVEQARTSKHQLIKKLQVTGHIQRYFNAAHGVVLPDVRDRASKLAARPDITPGLIAFGPDIPALDNWIRARLEAASSEHGNGLAGLGSGGCELLRDLITKPIYFPASMLSDVDSDAEKIEVLTEEQCEVLRSLSGARKVVVRGPAGSGKTVLAVRKVEMLSKDKKRILLLCFNRPLGAKLSRDLEALDDVTVTTFFQFVRSLWYHTGAQPLAETQLDQLCGTEQFAGRLLDGFIKAGNEEYDAIIVDEGQDFKPSWLTLLLIFLRRDDKAVFYLFLDDNQNVREEAPDFDGMMPFLLTQNLRNTQRIFELSEQYQTSGSDVIPRGPEGRKCEMIPASRGREIHQKLLTLLGKLITTEEISPSDIAVLCVNKEKAEILGQTVIARSRFAYVDAEAVPLADAIVLDSIARFKGLQSKVVIMILEGERHLSPQEFYTAITRAVSHFVAIGPRRSLPTLQ